MRVEIWSDVVCPWCYVGKERFAKGLADFPHKDEVEVVFRSFELDPQHPKGETEPVVQVLAKKYGVSEAEPARPSGVSARPRAPRASASSIRTATAATPSRSTGCCASLRPRACRTS
jgi:predicted DsbA family dithiol-disulfide isomerase